MKSPKERELERLDVRRKLWCDIYVQFARTITHTPGGGAKVWADKAIEEFDAKFPPQGVS